MAEPGAAVCDTHALLFHAARDRRLGRHAAALFAACEDQHAIVYVPVIVLWEISLLARRGHVGLGRSIGAFTDDLFSNPAYQPLDLTADMVVEAEAYRPNRDPFDALIVAAARSVGLPLITRDRAIADSRLVKTIW